MWMKLTSNSSYNCHQCCLNTTEFSSELSLNSSFYPQKVFTATWYSPCYIWTIHRHHRAVNTSNQNFWFSGGRHPVGDFPLRSSHLFLYAWKPLFLRKEVWGWFANGLTCPIKMSGPHIGDPSSVRVQPQCGSHVPGWRGVRLEILRGTEIQKKRSGDTE